VLVASSPTGRASPLVGANYSLTCAFLDACRMHLHKRLDAISTRIVFIANADYVSSGLLAGKGRKFLSEPRPGRRRFSALRWSCGDIVGTAPMQRQCGDNATPIPCSS